ncbi:MAG: hypothetical protein H7838_05000 [Magnetococcus sp. DMHC-8]
MAEGSFEQEVNRIQDHLKRAILRDDARAFGPAARELRHHWAVALVRGDRIGFRLANAAMLSVANMAHAYANPETAGDALSVWQRVWAFLGEAGAMIQEMNTDWTAEEQLAEIDPGRFLYAEQTLCFLDKAGMVTFASLLAHMSGAIVQGQQEETAHGTPAEQKRHARASLNNHLRRLVGHGLVVRAGWGLYRLTHLGKHAVRLIEKKKPRTDQPVVVYAHPITIPAKGRRHSCEIPGAVVINLDGVSNGGSQSVHDLMASGHAYRAPGHTYQTSAGRQDVSTH